MPIYEYNCSNCEKNLDVLQKVSDPPPAKCDSCGAQGTLSRQVSRTSFVLKGGGWYADLYGSSKKSSGSSEGGSSSGTAPTTGSSDSGGGAKGGGSSSTSGAAAAAAPTR
jgi:putative FmdB family regulatory protein